MCVCVCVCVVRVFLYAYVCSCVSVWMPVLMCALHLLSDALRVPLDPEPELPRAPLPSAPVDTGGRIGDLSAVYHTSYLQGTTHDSGGWRLLLLFRGGGGGGGCQKGCGSVPVGTPGCTHCFGFSGGNCVRRLSQSTEEKQLAGESETVVPLLTSATSAPWSMNDESQKQCLSTGSERCYPATYG